MSGNFVKCGKFLGHGYACGRPDQHRGPCGDPWEFKPKRANYIAAPHYFNLNQACRVVQEAFGWGSVYLVGSAIERRDYRDVDIRCILDDAEYDRLFPGLSGNPSLSAMWSLLCSSISLYLSQHSGLPVDFQIQKQTEANAIVGRTMRHPIGIFLEPRRVAPTVPPESAPTSGTSAAQAERKPE